MVSLGHNELTMTSVFNIQGLVMSRYVMVICHQWFRWWLVVESAPSYYWSTLVFKLMPILQWKSGDYQHTEWGQYKNVQQFPDDVFKFTFFNENYCILIQFSLEYVTKGPVDNTPALFQIMAWRRRGVKPLSVPADLNQWWLSLLARLFASLSPNGLTGWRTLALATFFMIFFINTMKKYFTCSSPNLTINMPVPDYSRQIRAMLWLLMTCTPGVTRSSAPMTVTM